jgi:hypothetical protein
MTVKLQQQQLLAHQLDPSSKVRPASWSSSSSSSSV